MMMTIDDDESGLFLQRAREPDALYFAPGHTRFAGREPGLLSQFWLSIFYPSPSALDDLMMVYLNSPAIENHNPQFSVNERLRFKSRRISTGDTVSSQVDSDSSEEESDIESIASTHSIAECESINEWSNFWSLFDFNGHVYALDIDGKKSDLEMIVFSRIKVLLLH